MWYFGDINMGFRLRGIADTGLLLLLTSRRQPSLGSPPTSVLERLWSRVDVCRSYAGVLLGRRATG